MDVHLVQEGPPFWCWRCMEREVPKALLLCATCARNEDRRAKKGERLTSTDERTHERYREDFSKADEGAYRRWCDLSGN